MSISNILRNSIFFQSWFQSNRSCIKSFSEYQFRDARWHERIVVPSETTVLTIELRIVKKNCKQTSTIITKTEITQLNNILQNNIEIIKLFITSSKPCLIDILN